jgi:hypothetical protein
VGSSTFVQTFVVTFLLGWYYYKHPNDYRGIRMGIKIEMIMKGKEKLQ